VCFKLVPQMIVKCTSEDRTTIRELLKRLEELVGSGEEVVVVVNGRIVSDSDFLVTEKDEVIFVQAFFGGCSTA